MKAGIVFMIAAVLLYLVVTGKFATFIQVLRA